MHRRIVVLAVARCRCPPPPPASKRCRPRSPRAPFRSLWFAFSWLDLLYQGAVLLLPPRPAASPDDHQPLLEPHTPRNNLSQPWLGSLDDYSNASWMLDSSSTALGSPQASRRVSIRPGGGAQVLDIVTQHLLMYVSLMALLASTERGLHTFGLKALVGGRWSLHDVSLGLLALKSLINAALICGPIRTALRAGRRYEVEEEASPSVNILNVWKVRWGNVHV